MRVCVVAMSDVTTDPRPRRNADLLQQHGVDVVAVGYPPRQPPPWPYVSVNPPAWSRRKKIGHAARLAAGRMSSGLAQRAFWRSPGTDALARAVNSVDADLYVSHDLYALPLVADAAARRGSRYAYDAREFYSLQHADRWLWRLLWPRYATALEQRYVRDAEWVSAVSEGLAAWLSDKYGLRPPAVVRSIPALRLLPVDHSPSTCWTVLFHGALRPDRNVHGLIASVPSWRAGLQLVVRGDGAASYVGRLSQMIVGLGIADRVRLEKAVPVTDVIATAAEADIGVIPWPLDLAQKRFSLPNKLFEYLAAGLAVIQTGPSESAELVDQFEAGSWYEPATPEALAEKLNSMSLDDLLRWRSGARRARQELNWEQEKERLWALYSH